MNELVDIQVARNYCIYLPLVEHADTLSVTFFLSIVVSIAISIKTAEPFTISSSIADWNCSELAQIPADSKRTYITRSIDI